MGATARAQRGRWGALWITLTSRRDTMFGPLGASGCVREVHGEQRIVWRKCATTCENPQCSAGQSRWSDASVGRCLGLGLMYRHPCWPRNRHALDMIRWWGVERCMCAIQFDGIRNPRVRRGRPNLADERRYSVLEL
jgi:hypothetical protein